MLQLGSMIQTVIQWFQPQGHKDEQKAFSDVKDGIVHGCFYQILKTFVALCNMATLHQPLLAGANGD